MAGAFGRYNLPPGFGEALEQMGGAPTPRFHNMMERLGGLDIQYEAMHKISPEIAASDVLGALPFAQNEYSSARIGVGVNKASKGNILRYAYSGAIPTETEVYSTAHELGHAMVDTRNSKLWGSENFTGSFLTSEGVFKHENTAWRYGSALLESTGINTRTEALEIPI